MKQPAHPWEKVRNKATKVRLYRQFINAELDGPEPTEEAVQADMAREADPSYQRHVSRTAGAEVLGVRASKRAIAKKDRAALKRLAANEFVRPHLLAELIGQVTRDRREPRLPRKFGADHVAMFEEIRGNISAVHRIHRARRVKRDPELPTAEQIAVERLLPFADSTAEERRELHARALKDLAAYNKNRRRKSRSRP